MTHAPEQIGDLVVAVYKEIKSKVEKELKPFGIGMGQLHVLMLFYAHDNSSFSQKELVKLLDIDKGNISRNVKKLVEKNYLEQVSEHSKQYQLSAQGRLVKSEVMTAFIALHHAMTSGVDQDELELTVLTLSKISKNLQAL